MHPHIEARSLSKAYPISAHESTALPSLRTAWGREPGRDRQTQKFKRAVDEISLSFRPGDRVGIIGRNGAGKTTLLGMLAGIIEPTSGTLEIEGHVTAVMTLGIGLRENLTGRENIYVDGEIQGKTVQEIDKIVDEVIAFADIGEFIDYPLRTYSTGMKARLAFAMLITVDPEILIIDEALSVGDAFFSSKATRKIRELCDLGKIVILASHGMHSVVEMCNRCVWIENGAVAMDGNPGEVTAAYMDKVRGEDEAVLLDRFRSQVGERSLRSGCRITQLTPMHRAAKDARVIFNTGDDVLIRIEVSLEDALMSPDLCCRVTRLDGLAVSENYFSETNDDCPPIPTGITNFELELTGLPLGAAVYKVSIELLDSSIAVAERAILIEVQSLRPDIGGRSALVYPSSIATDPLSHQESHACSDSTVAMPGSS
jgi:lipopolysaccharide transport system ATP-binding protein